jgi:hypothetical protein
VTFNTAFIHESEVMLSKYLCRDMILLFVGVNHCPCVIDGHFSVADEVETITDQLDVFNVIHGAASSSIDNQIV